jgi:hypothetical protein
MVALSLGTMLLCLPVGYALQGAPLHDMMMNGANHSHGALVGDMWRDCSGAASSGNGS